MADNWIERSVSKVAENLTTCQACNASMNTVQGLGLAGRESVYKVLDGLIGILFPGCHGHEPIPEENVQSFEEDELRTIAMTLKHQAEKAFHYECPVRKSDPPCPCASRAEDAVRALIDSLPEIKHTLQRDIQAAYEGDPAAKSIMEVVMSYPGFQAIVTHRIAHLLYQKGVPLIPRIMSERAHALTGIDIHPGAQIGPGFFIDHGTGVVIGETCRIGRNVKLYQGVTLGALSFPKDEHGHPIKGIKRHPNVEDNVTIYAGATILGGETTIGAGSEIGGNVWLIHSVPPDSRVYNQQPRPLIRSSRSRKPPAAKRGRGRKMP